MEEEGDERGHRLRLKRLEHPYLHDLFRSVLLYDAERVKRDLADKIGGRLLIEWKLERPYIEILPNVQRWYRNIDNKYKGTKADVVWLLRKEGRDYLGFRRIVHEVRTGSFDLDELIKGYRHCEFLPSRAGYARATTTNTPLYVWSWPKHQTNSKGNNETSRLIRSGSVRLCSLAWLLGILCDKKEEIFEWR